MDFVKLLSMQRGHHLRHYRFFRNANLNILFSGREGEVRLENQIDYSLSFRGLLNSRLSLIFSRGNALTLISYYKILGPVLRSVLDIFKKVLFKLICFSFFSFFLT